MDIFWESQFLPKMQNKIYLRVVAKLDVVEETIRDSAFLNKVLSSFLVAGAGNLRNSLFRHNELPQPLGKVQLFELEDYLHLGVSK